MKALFSATLLAASCAILSESRAQTGAVGIGTASPQAQLHTTASVRHDTLAGMGSRLVYADALGRLHAPQQNFFSNTTPTPIPDAGCNLPVPVGATSSIAVIGQPTAIASSKIRLRLDITHTDVSHLVIYLQASNGQVLRLISNVYSVNLTNTVFSDAAFDPINYATAPGTGVFRPLGTTSASCGVTPNVNAFAGFGNGNIIPNGTWSLLLFDRFSGSIGTLNNWSISFDGSDPMPNQILSANRIPKGGAGGLVDGTLYDFGGGIGLNTPVAHGMLQFPSYSDNRKIVLSESANNIHQFQGFGTDYYGLRYQIGSPYESHVFYSAANASSSKELFRITGSGRVGIGNAYPNAPLQFENSFANRKLVLYESWDNDHQFMGFGAGGGFLRYQVPGAGDDHIFFSGNGANASTELMRITGDGYVGIGTTLPGQKAKVEIHGGAWSTPTVYRYMNSSADGNTTNSTPNYYSLYTTDRIWCGGEINVTSDQRTKERIAASLPSADLALVNKLRVVDYNYVDRATKGDTRVKGFLAQEVEAVMPDAVMKNCGVVPNIYKKAESARHDAFTSTLFVAMKSAHGLKAGDTVKLIADSGERLVTVVAVKDSLHFTVGGWKETTDWVFVYGTQVHDLRNLDYNKIFSAGISAIQELSREVTNLEKRMSTAEENASNAKREVAELRTWVERLVKAGLSAQR